MELISSEVASESCLYGFQENGLNSSSSSSITPFVLHSKFVPEDSNTYVLGITVNNTLDPNFAVSLSSNNIKLYSAERLISVSSFSGHEKTITRIKFSSEDPNLVFSSSLDGSIRVWDVRHRKKNPVQTFIDNNDEIPKPLTSFDISLDESNVCGGSELVRDDSFLLFWDRRNSKHLGGYWNSHTDDITEVRYHPHKHSILLSGSVDGLINVFDLNEDCESNALLETFNTGSSVEKVIWNARKNEDLKENQLICLTNTQDLQVWNIKETSPFISYDRDTIKSFSKNDDTEVEYLIDVYLNNGQIYLATGTKEGKVNIWNLEDKTLSLWTQMEGIHKDVVRAVWYMPEEPMFITGGEDGIVCFWRKGSSFLSTNYKAQSNVKVLSKRRGKKPY